MSCMQEGGNVSVLDKDENLQKNYGPNVAFYKTDVSKGEEVRMLLARLFQNLGMLMY